MTKQQQVEALQKALIQLGEIEYKAKFSEAMAQIIQTIASVGRDLLSEIPKEESANTKKVSLEG